MAHTRGQIELSKDILGDLFAKVYTGCPYLDDYYTCDLKDAQCYYYNTLEDA